MSSKAARARELAAGGTPEAEIARLLDMRSDEVRAALLRQHGPGRPRGLNVHSIRVRLPDDVMQRLEHETARKGCSRNDAIVTALRRAFRARTAG